MFKKIIIIFITLNINNLFAATIGSDTVTAAAQSYTFVSGVDNRIANYALMGWGFTLSDYTVSTSFASIFPVQGGVFLNGGLMTLNKDVNFTNDSCFGGGGRIIGNGFKMEFGKPYNNVRLFQESVGALNLLDSENLGAVVNSVDWSYNDSYVAAGRAVGAGNELYVYNFNGSTLSLGTSVDFAAAINCVRWHPSQNYLAVGVGSAITGNELRVYSWNGSSLTETSGFDAGIGANSVAWSKDGNYFAATAATSVVGVFSFSGGILSLITTLDFSGSGTPSINALDWSPDGRYLVIGTNGTGASLRVYYFDGATLTLDSSVSGITVQTVTWQPTGDLIAVGLSGTAENFRIYEHSSGLLTEKTNAALGIITTIYSLDWSDNGRYLLAGEIASADIEFYSVYFSTSFYRPYPIALVDIGLTVASVAISHSGNFFLNGAGNTVNVYGVNNYDLTFYDTNLIFNTDLDLAQNLIFNGNCKIDAKGRIINIRSGQIQVAQNSNLKIKNAKISGLNVSRLKNLASSSSITLQNCTLDLFDDYIFNTGSLLIKQDVIVSGNSTFNYTSRFTCTIDKNSCFYIDNGITFNYAPSAAKNNLIYMTDQSSVLYLNNCTLSTTNTGILLTQGTLILDNNINFSSTGLALSESIKLGSGIAAQDLNVIMDSSVNLNIYGGFEYNNVT